MLPRRSIALLAALCLCRTLQAGGSPAEVKAAFRKLLDRPRVALDVRKEASTVEGGFAIVRESFASEKKADGTVERVPVLLVKPAKAKGRLPAVIVLHGTGGSMWAKGVAQFVQDLAKRGIIGVAID